MENANLDERMFIRQRAMISSMTKKERAKPDILNGSRRKRIAKGAGVDVSELNKLLKMHRQMADMMKTMGRNPGMMQKMAGALGISPMGGMGKGPSEAELMKMQEELASLDPKALEQLPPELKASLPKGLPGLGGGALGGKGLPGLGGGGLPGLGGAPRFPGLPGKKK
jgi:signal recognition particle subunit SRP54